MGVFRPRPPVIRPDWGHPILRSQTCWFAANDQSRAPIDILQGAFAATLLKSGVSVGAGAYGEGWKCDGSANGYIDLGSTNRFIASDATPVTVSWTEHHAGAATNAGIVGLFPTGAAKQFTILRVSANVINAGAYGRLAAGPWAATGILPSFLGPPQLSDNVPLVFVVTGLAGTASQTAANWTVWWAGSSSGRQTSSSGGNAGNLGATANYFGWDNADAKFNGVLDNLRVWNRVLSEEEIKDLLEDPYLGSAGPRDYGIIYLIPPAVAATTVQRRTLGQRVGSRQAA